MATALVVIGAATASAQIAFSYDGGYSYDESGSEAPTMSFSNSSGFWIDVYIVLDGDATYGEDYNITADAFLGQLPGQTSQGVFILEVAPHDTSVVYFHMTDDWWDEEQESVTIEVDAAAPYSITGSSTAEFYIEDDDEE